MARILVINPNSSAACTAGIAAAVAPFRLPGGPAIEVIGLAAGPPAIYGWASGTRWSRRYAAGSRTRMLTPT